MIATARALFILLLGAREVLTQGFQVDWESDDSIKAAASVMARDLMSYYDGNQPGRTPGLLYLPPDPRPWWWAGGALFGTMIDYWHFTKDTSHNEVVKAGMVHQAGKNQDFLTPNWTAHMGNDDQGFWGMSAMLAAETGFDDPPPDEPQWLATAQGVFNTMASPERHDKECGGGLRWQLNFYSPGYTYKNSISNGIFFNLGARLARYTGNATYAEWANKTWDWQRSVGLIDNSYAIYDGAHVEYNCTDINRAEYTYNSGVWLQGAAFLYNYTNGAPEWRQRVEGLLNHTLATFFPKKIAMEIVCQNEATNLCGRDQLVYKGVTLRWLTTIAQLAPFTNSKILPVVQASAKAAVSQCTGGDNGRMCGFQWTSGKYDGKTDVGTEMSGLSALISILYQREYIAAPVTHSTGGTSKGDSTAGSSPSSRDPLTQGKRPITITDRACATILTLIVILAFIGVQVWMILD